MDPVAPALVLEPPDAPKGQVAVAVRYGVSLRTIKRWVAVGREHKDPPPLDSATSMQEWARRMVARRAAGFSREVPEEIELVAERESRAVVPPAAAADAEVIAGEPAGSGSVPGPALQQQHDIDLDTWDPEAVSYDHVISAAKLNFAVQQSLLRKAYESKDKDQVRTALVSFREAMNQLREVERDRQKIMLNRGELLRRDEVRKALNAVHAVIPGTFRSRLKAAFPSISTLTESRYNWEEWVDATVDEICRHMVESKFAMPA
jgi:hypothetical protein